MGNNRVYGCRYNGELMLKVYTKNGIYLTSLKNYIEKNLPIKEGFLLSTIFI